MDHPARAALFAPVLFLLAAIAQRRRIESLGPRVT
jgi:hypothetical protein